MGKSDPAAGFAIAALDPVLLTTVIIVEFAGTETPVPKVVEVLLAENGKDDGEAVVEMGLNGDELLLIRELAEVPEEAKRVGAEVVAPDVCLRDNEEFVVPVDMTGTAPDAVDDDKFWVPGKLLVPIDAERLPRRVGEIVLARLVSVAAWLALSVGWLPVVCDFVAMLVDAVIFHNGKELPDATRLLLVLFDAVKLPLKVGRSDGRVFNVLDWIVAADVPLTLTTNGVVATCGTRPKSLAAPKLAKAGEQTSEKRK